MNKKTSSTILIILGLLILVSILFQFHSAVYGWIFFVVGAITMIISFASVDNAAGVTWISALIGTWLVWASFMPGIHSGAGMLVHNIITGVLITAIGLLEMRAKEGSPVY